MAYTVKKLSELSGVSVRTLHHYDEIDLLKPAYIGANGYRYYEEEELLLLQQILFFRELKIELKQIRRIMKKSDFDQKAALSSHLKILQEEMTRLQEMVSTIEKTIKHHKGETTMKDEEIFEGLMPSKEKIEQYEASLVRRFGEPYKEAIASSKEKAENATPDDWVEYFQENNEINKALVKAIEGKLAPDSKEVQELIKRHYDMLSRLMTLSKEVYLNTIEIYSGSQPFKDACVKWHPDLVDFLIAGMKVFADQEL